MIEPVWMHRTGREVLVMYARLRGVPAGQIGRLSSRLIARLGLDAHADKYVAHTETSPSVQYKEEVSD